MTKYEHYVQIVIPIWKLYYIIVSDTKLIFVSIYKFDIMSVKSR